MQPLNTKNLFFSAFIMALASQTCFAEVDGFSRACRFYDLGRGIDETDDPNTLTGDATRRGIAKMLMKVVKAPYNPADRSIEEQYHTWALESFTTDYGKVRYYLGVENYRYYMPARPDSRPRIYDNWKKDLYYYGQVLNHAHPLDYIDSTTFISKYDDIFQHNRRWLYSVLANPGIWTVTGSTITVQSPWGSYPTVFVPSYSYSKNYKIQDYFVSFGRHYYITPSALKIRNYILPKGPLNSGEYSAAVNCNLREYGIISSGLDIPKT